MNKKGFNQKVGFTGADSLPDLEDLEFYNSKIKKIIVKGKKDKKVKFFDNKKPEQE